MSESVRRLKANKVVAGKKCGWCREPLAFGEDAAICEGCRALHHGACWDERGGCTRAGCVNAPLQRVAPVPAPPPISGSGGSRFPATGLRSCPHCGARLTARAVVCRKCGLAPTTDGVYRGPKQNAPGAVASLVCGIIGIFVCGIVLGPIAIVNANKAKSEIRRNPRFSGGGMATAGLVLGILDLALFVVYVLIQVGMRR